MRRKPIVGHVYLLETPITTSKYKQIPFVTPSPDGKASFNMLVHSRLLPIGTIVMYLGDNLSTMEEDLFSPESLIIANVLILESNSKEMLVLHRGKLPMNQKDMFLAAHHNFFLFFKELG